MLLELLVEHGYVPVLACLGAGADGAVYNINADTVANRVAVELGAEGLFLISDVPGVLRDVSDPASRIARLTVAEGRELIATGAVTRGMIPKLEESFAALAEGVRAHPHRRPPLPGRPAPRGRRAREHRHRARTGLG